MDLELVISMTKTPTQPEEPSDDTRLPSPEDDSPREQSLDETIESTFPASDPPSTIPAPEPDLEHTGSRDVHDEGAPAPERGPL